MSEIVTCGASIMGQVAVFGWLKESQSCDAKRPYQSATCGCTRLDKSIVNKKRGS